MKQFLKTALPRPAAQAAYFKALFENEIELRLLPFFCDRDRTSVDVGAFTGTWTVGMHRHSRRVVAVEPQPKQAAWLRQAMPRGVQVVEAALSDAARDAWLEMNDAEGGSMSQVKLTADVEAGRIAQRIRLMRLDDVAGDSVGFVKIDAEGHECEVLRGGMNTLQRSRPALVIEAEERVHARAVEQVRSILEPLDYTGHFVYRSALNPISEFNPTVHQDMSLFTGGRRLDYQDYINNFIFLPRERAGSFPRAVPPAWAAVRSSFFG